MANRAVFLDRDGTINEEVDHLDNPDQFVLLPRVAEAIKLLNKNGQEVIVVSNQAGVARELFAEEMVHDIHAKMKKELADYGAYIDGVYYCPHHPEVGNATYRKKCGCRKPEPGMLQMAAKDFDLDLRSCYMVGDKVEDILAGQRVGCTTVLVLTGYGKEQLVTNSTLKETADFIADDLLEAAKWIVSREQKRL